MNGPEEFKWNDGFKLGYGPMDQTHEEFVEIVGAMLVCPEEEILGHLEAFAAHAEAHFAQELKWMTETDFPSTGCHDDEHAAVMKSVNEVRELLKSGGDPAVARSLAEALADWFPGHADYLDSALAQWLVKRKMNGVPLVFRRKDSMNTGD